LTSTSPTETVAQRITRCRHHVRIVQNHGMMVLPALKSAMLLCCLPRDATGHNDFTAHFLREYKMTPPLPDETERAINAHYEHAHLFAALPSFSGGGNASAVVDATAAAAIPTTNRGKNGKGAKGKGGRGGDGGGRGDRAANYTTGATCQYCAKVNHVAAQCHRLRKDTANGTVNWPTPTTAPTAAAAGTDTPTGMVATAVTEPPHVPFGYNPVPASMCPTSSPAVDLRQDLASILGRFQHLTAIPATSTTDLALAATSSTAPKRTHEPSGDTPATDRTRSRTVSRPPLIIYDSGASGFYFPSSTGWEVTGTRAPSHTCIATASASSVRALYLADVRLPLLCADGSCDFLYLPKARIMPLAGWPHALVSTVLLERMGWFRDQPSNTLTNGRLRFQLSSRGNILSFLQGPPALMTGRASTAYGCLPAPAVKLNHFDLNTCIQLLTQLLAWCDQFITASQAAAMPAPTSVTPVTAPALPPLTQSPAHQPAPTISDPFLAPATGNPPPTRSTGPSMDLALAIIRQPGIARGFLTHTNGPPNHS